ncbi:hypothetical protein Nepgr_002930 [Nepenthes gracilis]|uniref:C2 NT-type domain-containing protein n=1 Tax=Nepenthes gracilis TaxID=150966 RepID=A0AAD3P752_NEPGR|nr:hypothetical protein Nepgr_002930 [Nepenthes gracilis]
MSRITKWKIEKTKVKVVFRLQFHATHIPRSGWDKLFVSLVPADSGKVTAKTTKANVRNGNCKWADPIYETTRLLQDAKTKQYEEKLYKLVVAMGSSRSSLLGEANINLVDYADALNPIVVALPLYGSDAGAILHVTVQLLTSKTGFREFEQQREFSEKGLLTTSNHDSGKASSPKDSTSFHIDKVNSRVRFKREPGELPSLEEEANSSEGYAELDIGFDGSSNVPESSHVEKHDTSSSTLEIDSVKSTVSGDVGGLSLSQSPRAEKLDSSDNHFVEQGTSDWVQCWSSDNSIDTDLAIVYHENSRLRGGLEAAEQLSIHELKQEISTLQSHADDIGVETQKLTEQLASEIASARELSKEVSLLKLECLRFKDDIGCLKSSKIDSLSSRMETIDIGQVNLPHDSNLRWLKGLLILEDKIRDLQNKAYLVFHENDFKFLLPHLEVLLSVLQDLKRGTGHLDSPLDPVPVERENIGNISKMSLPKTDDFISEAGFGVELCHPEGVPQCLSIPGLVTGSIDAATAMQGELFRLLRELDESKSEQETLARKMDQMECYYEALIQELEEKQKRMLGEYQNLRNEHSTCIYTISSTKAQMEALQQDMNEEILRLCQERCNLDSFNKELERRAVTSEAALRRARLNYSIAVNQLQKDLEVLSLQVLSMYETNENLIRRAVSEASQPCFLSYPDAMQGEDPNAEDANAAKFMVCQNQHTGLKNQLLGGDMLLEDLKKSLMLQEELYQKIEEEFCEMLFANIQLDVFAQALQHTLQEANADIMFEKENLNKLMEQLDHSTKSNELLTMKLQIASEDISALIKDNSICVARCNDIAQQNQILEAKCRRISDENSIFAQKIAECEALVTECKTYKSRYEACEADRTELACLLEHTVAENRNISNKVSLLQEESRTLTTQFGGLASSKENLQKIVGLLREKLGTLIASYCEQFVEPSLCDKLPEPDLDFKGFLAVMSQLEDLQHSTSQRVLQLMKEKKDLEDERDFAKSFLITANYELEVMKEKLEHDMPDMFHKLNASNTLVENVQMQLEVIGSRLKGCSEAEAKYLTVDNRDLLHQILALGSMNEELERNKLLVEKITQDNEDLRASLQNNANESNSLVSELNTLKGALKSLNDELLVERGCRHRLECEVSELTLELRENSEKMLHLELQKAETVNVKKSLLKLELEKSSVWRQFLKAEEGQRTALEGLSLAETNLLDMHELLLAADVKEIFLRVQYKSHMLELLQQRGSRDWQLQELNLKLYNLDNMLKQCLASEANYAKENAALLSTLESLRCELELSIAQNKALEDTNSLIAAELKGSNARSAVLESRYANDKAEQDLQIKQLRCMLASCHEEIDISILTKEELEIRFLVLKTKLDEQCFQTNLQSGYNDEMMILQQQYDELNRRLSEQILKTEEFKNLSIHLKELNDKADAVCVQARQKREAEGSPVMVQESLRIAFIKEQYETKLQELKHQLSISKKHGEEMLRKLQDFVDQLEDTKRSEASQLKRNEELSLKILELEDELQSVISANREKIKAYDQVKAELECSLISLECCKEEKQKLMNSVQQCNEEKSRIEARLLKREMLESSYPSTISWTEQKDGSHMVEIISNEQAGGHILQENSTASARSHCNEAMDVASVSGFPGSWYPKCLEHGDLIEFGEHGISTPVDGERARSIMITQLVQGAQELSGQTLHKKDLLDNDAVDMALINGRFKAQSLKSSMEQLHQELERMKSENSHLSEGNHPFEPYTRGLQRELTMLGKVNEELGSISPEFNDFSSGGNSVERVLALELELAEALQAKKKSSLQFQSSFLKQLSDEAAVLRSFRDINELIKDMLELKASYSAMEMELTEMHERYSQLSLQFAEVEGERQRLMMTLKNTRASKKLLSGSSSASVPEPSS